MDVLIAIYLFILGACFGSFAGAMAWRIEKGKKVVRERSECEHCHHKLSPIDLLPVISWLWLRGKCRYCKKPIGFTALLLEVVLGTCFALSYLFWPLLLAGIGGWILFGLWLVALTMLAILFVYDVRHYLLPDVVMWPLIYIGFLFFMVLAFKAGTAPLTIFINFVLSLLPVAGVYGLLYGVSKGKWVGLGDVKLGAFIGLMLGWQGALLALILANLIGLLWVAPGLIRGTRDRTGRVPFGPFLIAGTFIAFLWGSRIISLYLDFAGF